MREYPPPGWCFIDGAKKRDGCIVQLNDNAAVAVVYRDAGTARHYWGDNRHLPNQVALRQGPDPRPQHILSMS